MGVPMIQTKVRRRTSLIWGTLLAVLLGVAAAFVILAMPIRMLETVTTATRLAKLMVQAEPPISPNDRTLLAVLFGIFTAGIGWILVDWLLFGRAGMSTLIRAREDDYEDEDDNAFRPTDPLDLVTPMAPAPAARSNDWATGSLSDTRRPLSARTDIGDPPIAMPGVPMARPEMVAGQALPPLGQILPGAGMFAPPLPSAVPIPPIQPPQTGQPAAAGALWDAGGPPSWPPLELGNVAPQHPDSFAAMIPPQAPVAPVHAANMPSWLPAPGYRPETALSGAEIAQADDLSPSLSEAHPLPHVPPPLPIPQPPAIEPLIPLAETGSLGQMPERPGFPSDVPPGQSAIQHGLAASPSDVFGQPAPAAQAAPNWDSLAQQPPAAPSRGGGIAGFEADRLEDLLTKLEQKVRSRRAAQAQAAAAAVSAVQPAAIPPRQQADPTIIPATPAPVVPPPIQRTELPAGFAAPPPVAPTAIPQQAPDAPAFPEHQAYGAVPPTPPQAAPALVQSIIPVAAPVAPAMLGDGQREAMLEQPLHVTLDQLRNMVRR